MNYKIEVKSEAESKEAQEFFVVLGAVCCSGLEKNKNVNFLFMNSGFVTACKLQENFDKSRCKEITLPQLRDMVVLKRNDVGDATHGNAMYPYVRLSDGWYYFDKGESNRWLKSVGGQPSYYENLKPIEKPMKEYLNKLTDGTYKLVVLDSVADGVEGLIEIPEGAESFNYFGSEGNVFFLKNNGEKILYSNETEDWSWQDWGDIDFDGVVFLWQRHTQPEELPFVDDEPSLNEQYAEIEQVRQNTVQNTLNERESTYGSFTGVANTTGQLMGVLLNSKNGQTLPYVHQEALHMICSKMARIVNGDHNHKDSWHDIAGYATLIERL